MFLFGHHTWRGESGRKYRFRVCLFKSQRPRGGGIYMFVRRRWIFWLKPLYVGKATHFRNRLLKHEKWPRAYWELDATEHHLLPLDEAGEGYAQRAETEEDLIRGLQPIMNDQLIPRTGKDTAMYVGGERKGKRINR